MKKQLLITLIAALIVVALVYPVSICAATTASRTVPQSVAPGAEFEVTISVSGYGDFGLVKETLPTGFTYLGLSEPNASVLDKVTPGTQEVKFYLLSGAIGSFTYEVSASNVKGPHTFTGTITDDVPTELSMADSTVYVGAVAIRDMPASVNKGVNFVVTMQVSGYGGIGLVEETLPAGFAFQSSDIEGVEVVGVGQQQKLRFALMGEENFTYTVKASSQTGTYSFSGIIKDIDKEEIPVGGDLSIIVKTTPSYPGGGYIPPATPTATPAPTPTVTVAPTPIVTPTPAPTYTPTVTPTPPVTPTPIVTPTPVVTPTPTPVEEEGGVPAWGWVLIALAIIIGVVIVVVIVRRMRGSSSS